MIQEYNSSQLLLLGARKIDDKKRDVHRLVGIILSFIEATEIPDAGMVLKISGEVGQCRVCWDVTVEKPVPGYRIGVSCSRLMPGYDDHIYSNRTDRGKFPRLDLVNLASEALSFFIDGMCANFPALQGKLSTLRHAAKWV